MFFFFLNDAKLVGHWSLAELEESLPSTCPCQKKTHCTQTWWNTCGSSNAERKYNICNSSNLRMPSLVLMASCISSNWVNITNCFPTFILLPQILMNAHANYISFIIFSLMKFQLYPLKTLQSYLLKLDGWIFNYYLYVFFIPENFNKMTFGKSPQEQKDVNPT